MRKILAVFCSLLLFFSLTIPVSAQVTTLSENETIDRDYLTSGSNITLNGTVNGDAYIAGGTIEVNGEINGDLLAAGGTIIISGNIENDVRVVGGNVHITNADIGGSVSVLAGQLSISDSVNIAQSIAVAGGNVIVSAPIPNGANIAAGSVTLSSKIGDRVQIASEEITIAPGADIQGDLNYWSSQEANIDEEATISGTINQNITPQKEDRGEVARTIFGIAAIFAIMEFILAFLLGLLVIYGIPLFSLQTVKVLMNRTWLSLGIGVLFAILWPIGLIVLMMTVIGIPVALVLLIAFFVYLYFAKIYVSYTLGNLIFRNGTRLNKALVLFVGLFAFYVISYLPFIGGLFQFFAVLFGFGAILISTRSYFNLLRSKKLI